MAPQRGVCRNFAQSGTCRFGQRCRFEHISGRKASSQARSSAHATRGISTGTPKEKLPSNLRQWIRDVHEMQVGLHPIFTTGLFEQARDLLQSATADVNHEVIKTLASESGSRLIRNATECSVTALKGLILPFLQVITHADSVTSLVLEQHIGTIYTVLYGINGLKGVAFFRNVSQAIVNIRDQPDTETQDIFEPTLACALDAFARMIAINQGAAINDGVKQVAQELEIPGKALLDDPNPQSFEALTAIKSWREIQVRLEIGGQLPEANDDIPAITRRLAQFSLNIDLPGDLCRTGARHDNDSADIRKIQILPTAEEIRSELSEYLPTQDPRTHHVPGVMGLLDRQFRLLREDTVGQLRDAVRQLIIAKTGVQRNAQQIRTNLFRHAVITGSFFDRMQGLLHVVEFDQPANMRKSEKQTRQRAWAESRDLAVDACVCIVGKDNDVTFYTVVERTPSSMEEDGHHRGFLDKSMLGSRTTTLFQDDKRAAVIVRLVDFSGPNALKILGQQSRALRYENAGELVEFPGVLLASFSHTLKALQEMSETRNLPFSDLIAPTKFEASDTVQSQPPQYATRAGFEFNLSKIGNNTPIHFSLQRAFDMAAFSEASGLDESQSNAFIHALSNRFALIQGPPGTGKSYVGVKIIQTLLENRTAANLGPILCVCYTNHALDQILEHLVDNGVEQIIRIGGRSKSQALQEVNLAQLSREMERTKNESHVLWQTHTALEELAKEALPILGKISNADAVATIRRHLEQKHWQYFKHFFSDTADDDGFVEVNHDAEKNFRRWLAGGSRESAVARTEVGDVRSMSHLERQHLFNGWVREIRQDALLEIRQLCDSFVHQKDTLNKCHNETSLRCLRQARVVGVTTTGLAKNVNLLRKLNSKVLIVEEAGEVLEAHMLPAILPTLEHVIAIGDHQQLRPHIANYELSAENKRGVQYSLDVSLFERLIYPPAGLPSLPIATLQTQRRMHPLISRLIRNTIYPKLKDSSAVSQYAPVTSLHHRLFWLDHQEPEVPDDMSKSNDFEVEMVAAFVTHLVKQGTYTAGQITVLTPYLAQFRKLRRRLAGVLEIVVGDKDKEVLVAAGMEDEVAVPVQRAHLAQQLRISTVDNYQGEESDIIVVSLVRSNEAGKVGFLRTPNRINVLLSRARHGMFIFGNRSVAENVPMWKQVTEMLEEDQAIGPVLSLFCPRHPEAAIEVSTPDDFSRFAPEGGCSLICDKRLKCGHSCINKCHAQHLHDNVVCQNPCPRLRKECSHKCSKVCGKPCDDKCQTRVFDIPLPCGHVAKQLKCHESLDIESVLCKSLVTKRAPGCKHDVQVHCSTDVSDKKFLCKTVCGALLPCGHNCARRCHECNTEDDDGRRHTRHAECKKVCDRPAGTCSHRCQKTCHGDVQCGPCTQKCQVACIHSKCSKRCTEPCAPCAETCTWSCEHQGSCKLPCSVPCNRLPCTERCTKELSCGHQCPSICGETCPSRKFCQVCGDASVLDMEIDYIMFSKYREIDLTEDPVLIPACGHLQTVSSMDGQMDLKSFYQLDQDDRIVGLSGQSRPFELKDIKSCPTCRGPLRSINRYSRIVKRGLIDEATKRFIVWANANYVAFESATHKKETRLAGTVDDTKFNTSLGTRHDRDMSAKSLIIELKGSSTRISDVISCLSEARSRYSDLGKSQLLLRKFVRQVSVEEQPFRRVWDLCRTYSNPDENEDDMKNFESAAESALNTRNHLLARSLLLHTDVCMLYDFVEIWNRSRTTSSTMRALSIDAANARKECVELFDIATTQEQPIQQVEALINYAFYTAAELKAPADSSQIDDLRAAAILKLKEAERIMQQKQSAAVLENKVKSAHTALTGTFQSLVTDDEMRAVTAAMATEFRGTGHWYRCANGHPFTIGECGMPMERARCPQCGAAIGGQHHTAVEGVERATDIEQRFMGN